MTGSRIGPGSPSPLGATWDGKGTNFALCAERATGVELCLFDHPGDAVEAERIQLRERLDGTWHTYLPDVRPGQAYGYRVHGRWAPHEGLRFNPAKLLLDPYAKAVDGTLQWSDALSGPLQSPDPDRDLILNPQDTAGGMPKSLVVEPAFDWEDDQRLRTPWNRTLVYECHVKGMTMRHPEVPEELRGTYLGLATDPIIDHLKSLEVTALELLPVHQMVTERRLAEQGLTNYWGYNSISFFAPDVRYAARTGPAGRQVAEFKSMVKRLHAAGIEVILDVVYNHTAEGNHLGPTLSFRGIDNPAYYRLDPENPRLYANLTGCGNTVDGRQARVLELVLDSLRYWITDFHVDGFRFDMAPILARGQERMEASAAFFEMVREDPVVSQVKLIAEPWDLGPDGYQVGRFPVGWSEWNGKYRDTVRQFWRSDAGQVGALASRLTGSSDLYEAGGRSPLASINFMTCHDGFTLHDLVSYEAKHNEANGENNRDGSDHNLSRNWGAEGATETTHIVRMRERIKRNFLATLAFSQGVPMLSHGDELGRTQQGNNNAYCHDSPLTWIDWNLTPNQRELLQFTRMVMALRAGNPVFRRSTFFRHDIDLQREGKELTWLRSDGAEMAPDDWNNPANHVLGMLLDGSANDTLLLLLNGGARIREFVLPVSGRPGSWSPVLDTAHSTPAPVREGRVSLATHSLMLLRSLPDRMPTGG